ncbi:unnamed protein product [Ixodes hexagonus]
MPAAPGPEDRYHFVSFTMFLFGIGSLLPWNFFITADDYWRFKLRDVNANVSPSQKSDLQAAFTSYLAIASKVPYIVSLLANAYLSHRVKPAVRIGWPLLGCTLLFVATAALVKVNTDQHQLAFLAATLTIVVLINIFSGFLQGGGTGLAGCFPEKYMASNVYGQAVGGVFATVAQILCLLMNASPTTSALLYFTLAVVTLIFTQVCFGVLVKTVSSICFIWYWEGILTCANMQSQAAAKVDSQGEEEWKGWGSKSRGGQRVTIRSVSQGWMYFLSIVLIFWVTLSVFPAIMVLVVSTDAGSGSPISNTFFLPVAGFLVFNVGDLVGRVISGVFPMVS